MTPGRRIIPVFVPHLGCPNSCVFCNQRLISGKTAPAVPETVIKAVSRGISIAPGGDLELAFYGGSFTAIPSPERRALLAAALPFLRSGEISAVRVSTRPDAIDRERLKELREYGVMTVELGAQSMREQVLTASGRGHTAQDTVRASELIKNAGLRLGLQMMTGLPGDDDEGAIESAAKIIELEPCFARIYPTVIIKDTGLYHMWRRGEYREHTVEDAVRVCAKILPMFEERKIPVIRLGLNPGEELVKSAAGGALHPALGELILSEIFLSRARRLLDKSAEGKAAVLGVHKSRVSAMVGQHRRNISAITEEFGLKSLKIVEHDVKKDEIKLLALK